MGVLTWGRKLTLPPTIRIERFLDKKGKPLGWQVTESAGPDIGFTWNRLFSTREGAWLEVCLAFRVPMQFYFLMTRQRPPEGFIS